MCVIRRVDVTHHDIIVVTTGQYGIVVLISKPLLHINQTPWSQLHAGDANITYSPKELAVHIEGVQLSNIA